MGAEGIVHIVAWRARTRFCFKGFFTCMDILRTCEKKNKKTIF